MFSVLAEALAAFISYLCQRNVSEPLWLLTLPMMHLLRKQTSAMMCRGTHRSVEWWGITGLEKQVTYFKKQLKYSM